MTEATNPAPVAKPVSRRCLCCRLPADVREELVERARLRGWATYAQIAENLSAEGFRLSEAAVRRHLRHVDPARFFEPAEGAEPQDVATPFDALVNAPVLDDRTVVEVLARSLVERLQRLERARQATRNPAQAERLMKASLDEMRALERALRRREELTQPRQELKATFFEFLQRVLEATKQACGAFIADHLQMMDAAINEHLDDYSHPERLVRRMREFQRDWPQTLRTRVMDAIRPIGDETLAALR